MTKFQSRNIALQFRSEEYQDGKSHVQRTIGLPELPSFDPFLMLDEFNTNGSVGYPDNPDRGFETVTYMHPNSAGSLIHEDFHGYHRILHAGDLQWMTAGRGMIYSKLPYYYKRAHGLQLKINLPNKLKLTPPRYQEFSHNKLTKVKKDGVTAIVIAGESMGVKSPVDTLIPIHLTHFVMEPDEIFEQEIPRSFNAFIYVFNGTAYIGDRCKGPVEAHCLVTLDQGGDRISVQSLSKGFEFVLVSGEPTGERVVKSCTFVMNTLEEVNQAINDFQSGRNGFENGHEWLSTHDY